MSINIKYEFQVVGSYLGLLTQAVQNARGADVPLNKRARVRCEKMLENGAKIRSAVEPMLANLSTQIAKTISDNRVVGGVVANFSNDRQTENKRMIFELACQQQGELQQLQTKCNQSGVELDIVQKDHERNIEMVDTLNGFRCDSRSVADEDRNDFLHKVDGFLAQIDIRLLNPAYQQFVREFALHIRDIEFGPKNASFHTCDSSVSLQSAYGSSESLTSLSDQV